MKNKPTKKFSTFILLLSGFFFAQFSNAQNCSSNKVWACRFDACGIQECKCINASQVQTWTATIPTCRWKFHIGHGGTWRVGQNESGREIETSLHAYPNPVSNSTTISFSLEQSQNILIRIIDTNGRLVSTLADASFGEGEHEIIWNAADVSAGIYFLQLTSQENSTTVKLSINK